MQRRRKHGTSLLHCHDGTCYLCMLDGDDRQKRNVQKHHIYGGPNRWKSEAEGFFVWLCPEHHQTGPAAVHASAHPEGTGNNRRLKRICQQEYEKTHTREEFMKLIGRSYL